MTSQLAHMADSSELMPAGPVPLRPGVSPTIDDLIDQWLEEFSSSGSATRNGFADPIDAVLAQGPTTSDAAISWWAQKLNLQRWDQQYTLSQASALAGKVSFEFASDHLLLLLAEQNTAANNGSLRSGCVSYRCLTSRPWHWQALDNLAMHLEAPLQLELAPEETVRDLIGRVYDQFMASQQPLSAAQAQSQEQAVEEGLSFQKAAAELNDRELLATSGKEPVAKLVDALLFDAARRNASDVHVHPYAEHLKIRLRLDGVLHDYHQLPKRLQDQVVGRIKVLAGMDVSEKRLAQDGRTSVQLGSRRIDLRVSTLPTTYGERAVIRLLEQTARIKDFGELGMPPEIATSFRQAIGRSTGLLLVTGPTGSGKTTTLYSALSQLDATARNILTLEDPVEYRLAGISQTQVSDKKGMTFLSGLRHILRQDPDVIMVGEIRDEPTARMVIQSSLTGHLVLSTLHTNSAAGAVARLMDLGVEPFLIASSLIGVLAQRLVRTCCSKCAGKESAGCPLCIGTGYHGRHALFEWLSVNSEIRQEINRSASAEQLQAAAVKAGMKTLRQNGQEAVVQGLTSEAEVLRVLGSDELE